jgi:hypothetical protein
MIRPVVQGFVKLPWVEKHVVPGGHAADAPIINVLAIHGSHSFVATHITAHGQAEHALLGSHWTKSGVLVPIGGLETSVPGRLRLTGGHHEQ